MRCTADEQNFATQEGVFLPFHDGKEAKSHDAPPHLTKRTGGQQSSCTASIHQAATHSARASLVNPPVAAEREERALHSNLWHTRGQGPKIAKKYRPREQFVQHTLQRPISSFSARIHPPEESRCASDVMRFTRSAHNPPTLSTPHPCRADGADSPFTHTHAHTHTPPRPLSDSHQSFVMESERDTSWG